MIYHWQQNWLLHFLTDDTVLSISGSNSTELQSIVNTELEKVNEWLQAVLELFENLIHDSKS